MAAALMLISGVAHGQQAYTAHVFLTETSSSDLEGRATTAVLAQLPGATIRFITPAVIPGNPTAQRPINGVQVRFAGYRESQVDGLGSNPAFTAHYVVMGDLILGSTDAVFAYGYNMLTLEVANNASIQPQAIIGSAAVGTIPGAGGGTSGGITLRPVVSVPAAGPLGGNGGAGGPGGMNPGNGSSGGDGQDWALRTYSSSGQTLTYDDLLLISSLTGGAGGEGANDYISSGGPGGTGATNPGDRFVGGNGGPGGGKGNDAIGLQPPGAGVGGYSGQAGARGPDGQTGANGGAAFDTGSRGFNFSTLRAGSGGGAGATPGHGHDGGGSGGGGGGGAGGRPLFSELAEPGRAGGKGGDGGLGGAPGKAGAGGAGGGGIEIVVRGRMVVNAAIFNVTGTGGFTGTAGIGGSAGGAGNPGVMPPAGSLAGPGGTGPAGGAGGTGGRGGNGGSGSGGNIHLVAAELYFDQTPLFLLDGGPGAASGLMQRHAFGGPAASSTRFARYAAALNPYRSYVSNPSDPTEFFSGAVPKSHSPNIPNLEEGGAPYGRRWNTSTNSFDSAVAQSLRSNPNRPSEAVGALTRGSYSFTGWDLVQFSAFNNLPLPRVSAVNSADGSGGPSAYVPEGPQPLRYFGLAQDPDSTPGATGPVAISPLGALQTWSTLVEAGKAFQVTAAYQPYGALRRFSATTATTASPLWVKDTGLLRTQLLWYAPDRVTLLGTPVDVVTDTTNLVINQPVLTTRVGTPQQNFLWRLTNVGNAGSRLPGSYTYPGLGTRSFVLDKDIANAQEIGSVRLTAAGAQRGATLSNAIPLLVNPTFDDFGPYQVTLNLDFVVAGPLFDATGLTTDTAQTQLKDAGDVPVNVPHTFTIGIANANDIPVLIPEHATLTLRGFSIFGPDASAFSVLTGGNSLQSGESLSVYLRFRPTRVGAHSATLYVFTDANAALGTAGDTYQIQLTGTGIIPSEVSAPLAESTSLWLRGEGNSESFSGANGTIVGNVGFTPGRAGQAFSFDGNGGYVALPRDAFPFPNSGNGTQSFTFETWFATLDGGVILGQQNAAPFATTSTGEPALYVGLDGYLRVEMFWAGAVRQSRSPTTVNDGNFHHIAVVYDAVQGASWVYLDGRSFTFVRYPQVGYSPTGYYYQLGTGISASRPSTTGGWFHFDGWIDEPAIYQRALTAVEIDKIYKAGGKGKSTPPDFTSIAKNGNNFTIGLQGWPALRFQLQHSQQLLPANYVNISTPVNTNAEGDAIFTFQEPIFGASSGFFRAIEVP